MTRYAALNATTVRRWPARAGTGVWEEPRWRLLTVDTPPTAFVVIVRSHHHNADTPRRTAEDYYWCGPPAPDRTVAWLQRADPVTRCWTVPGGVAVFDTAIGAAAAGALVAIGLTPTRPETGYGYLHTTGGGAVRAVAEFTEKPDLDTARRDLASGEHLWNASMFVWRAASFLEHLARYRPALHAAFTKLAAAWNTTDRDTVLADQWPALERISVDRAVMEPAAADGHVLAVPADMGWTDIGDWSTLGQVTANDATNSLLGDPGLITTSDSTECVIAAHSQRPVTVHGLQDVIVIDTPDTLLICHRNQAQHVGRLAR